MPSHRTRVIVSFDKVIKPPYKAVCAIVSV
jgi:hypothetical protein